MDNGKPQLFCPSGQKSELLFIQLLSSAAERSGIKFPEQWSQRYKESETVQQPTRLPPHESALLIFDKQTDVDRRFPILNLFRVSLNFFNVSKTKKVFFDLLKPIKPDSAISQFKCTPSGDQ
jgi:hypothetical protein